MIDKPANRDVVCHAAAWDFANDYDFRISMCTSVSEEDLKTVNHEMNHIEYYMAYSNQPAIFKNGANAGFHEAIGDTIALSVLTP
jgi:peptidyl-dipeptidase A